VVLLIQKLESRVSFSVQRESKANPRPSLRGASRASLSLRGASRASLSLRGAKRRSNLDEVVSVPRRPLHDRSGSRNDKTTKWVLTLIGLVGLMGAIGAQASVQLIQKYVLQHSDGYRFENRPSERTRPVVVGDIVYYATLEGKVVAVHRTQGYVLWKRQLGAAVEGALTYGRAKLFVGDLQGNLYALRARDGSIAWQVKIREVWLSPPVLHRDKLFAATSGGGIYAYKESTGEQLWYYPRKGVEKMTIRGMAGPTVFGGEIFQGFADGTVVALKASSGQEVWSKKLGRRDRFYDVDTPAYVDQTNVVIATYDGNLYNLDRLTGNLKWVFRVGSYGGFVVEKGKIFFAGLNGYFYSLGLSTGRVFWKTKFEKGMGLTPARVGKYLVFTTSEDPVYLIEAETGAVAWKGQLGAGSLAPAAVDPDGWVFMVSNYGNFYAYRVAPHRKSPKKFNLTLPSAVHRMGFNANREDKSVS